MSTIIKAVSKNLDLSQNKPLKDLIYEAFCKTVILGEIPAGERINEKEFSAGYANRFRHPRAGVVARWREAGAEVAGSAESGAVRVRIGRDGVDWSEERRRTARFWDAVARQAAGAGLSYRSDSQNPAQGTR